MRLRLDPSEVRQVSKARDDGKECGAEVGKRTGAGLAPLDPSGVRQVSKARDDEKECGACAPRSLGSSSSG